MHANNTMKFAFNNSTLMFNGKKIISAIKYIVNNHFVKIEFYNMLMSKSRAPFKTRFLQIAPRLRDCPRG